MLWYRMIWLWLIIAVVCIAPWSMGAAPLDSATSSSEGENSLKAMQREVEAASGSEVVAQIKRYLQAARAADERIRSEVANLVTSSNPKALDEKITLRRATLGAQVGDVLKRQHGAIGSVDPGALSYAADQVQLAVLQAIADHRWDDGISLASVAVEASTSAEQRDREWEVAIVAFRNEMALAYVRAKGEMGAFVREVGPVINRYADRPWTYMQAKGFGMSVPGFFESKDNIYRYSYLHLLESSLRKTAPKQSLAELYYDLGLTAERLKLGDEAYTWYTRYLEVDPDSPKAGIVRQLQTHYGQEQSGNLSAVIATSDPAKDERPAAINPSTNPNRTAGPTGGGEKDSSGPSWAVACSIALLFVVASVAGVLVIKGRRGK